VDELSVGASAPEIFHRRKPKKIKINGERGSERNKENTTERKNRIEGEKQLFGKGSQEQRR
jgi:hypothetical protein